MSDADVIAAGYLERLPAGEGSPFRLMEYALLDPRLTAGDRGPLVWALLDPTRAGRGYELDLRALTRIGTDPRGRDTDVGQRHLDLIEHAVRSADDPRARDLAVREAYSDGEPHGVAGRTRPRRVGRRPGARPGTGAPRRPPPSFGHRTRGPGESVRCAGYSRNGGCHDAGPP